MDTILFQGCSSSHRQNQSRTQASWLLFHYVFHHVLERMQHKCKSIVFILYVEPDLGTVRVAPGLFGKIWRLLKKQSSLFHCCLHLSLFSPTPIPKIIPLTELFGLKLLWFNWAKPIKPLPAIYTNTFLWFVLNDWPEGQVWLICGRESRSLLKGGIAGKDRVPSKW